MPNASFVVRSIENHPKRLSPRIKAVAADQNRVSFASSINDLASARELSMPQIWDCLDGGEVSSTGIVIDDEEIRGFIFFHSHEGLVTLSFAMCRDDTWLEVLSAQIEVK